MESYARRNKIILLISSLVFLVYLLRAAVQENFQAEWRGHQKAYAELLASRSSGRSAGRFPIEVRQIYLPELQRVYSCVTCHVAVDNPAFAGEAAPLGAHPGELLKHHPSEKFGCTICHLGQGRAISKADAHGDVPHWPEPLLRGDMVYTSCGRCHYENDLYAGQADLYGQVRPMEHISVGELNASLPGAENLARGKRLVVELGCLGCHKYRGRGGTLGPDITYMGEKTAHDLDFRHLPAGEPHTVANWLFAHFKSPAAVVPNTLMPEMGLSDDEARDLAAYMMSLKRKSAPAQYTPLPLPVDPTPVDGETLYSMYCSACHGRDGVGAIARDATDYRALDRPRELLTPSLRNADALGVASDAFLRQITAEGRPGTSMPAWAHEGLSDFEIDLLVERIRRWQPREADRALISASRGNPRYGESLYRANCAGCHALDGSGGLIGVSLRSPTFLAIASDEFLARTILEGRANTAMPAWREFDNREVSDLIAYIRQWQPVASNREETLALLARAPRGSADAAHPPDAAFDRESLGEVAIVEETEAEPSADIGLTLYRSRCVVCHGERGEGGIGPSLSSPSVLPAVTDAFLVDTIVRGRPGTAMPAWRQLGSRDVADLVSLLRSWQKEPALDLPPKHVTGDWQNGELLYTGMCASCHGPRAEGAIGPQLSNPVLLDTLSDATLIHWISYGRAGTAMRPFLQGQQGAAELSASQIEDIVTYLRQLRGRPLPQGQQIGLGFAPRGKVLYEQMCQSCHGVQGEGATGPGIRNPALLSAASDGYLRATIVLGREGTEMRSLAHRGSGIAELRADQIDDLIAFLRANEDTTPIPHRFVQGADLRQGARLYAQFCAGCHGEQGRGGFAPELNNAGFLRAATDGYLQATIIRGRRGTAMRSFAVGGHGLANLTQNQINDIVAYIRQWSPDVRPLRRAEVEERTSTTRTNE